MSEDRSFQGTTIVTCSALKPEMERLKAEGFLDADDIIYVRPGAHERPRWLEEDLPPALEKAAGQSERVLVALGRKCYFDFDRPERTIDHLIAETGHSASRVDAEDCVDMLADKISREELAAGRKVYWMTPGWVLERDNIFEGWDQGKANETFPSHDAAVLLDGLDFFNQVSLEAPEQILDFSDWMQISLEPVEVSLERLKSLLADRLQ